MNPLPDETLERLSAYALGSLDLNERALVEAELARSALARAELSALRATVADLSYAAPPATPPTHLRANLLAAIAAEAETAPRATRPLPRRESRWMAQPRQFVAVALVVLMIGSFGMMMMGRINQLEGRLAETEAANQALIGRLATAEQLLAAVGNSKATSMPLVVNSTEFTAASGMMYLFPETGALVICEGLPAPEAGMVYRVWLADEAGMVTAGTLSINEAGQGVLMVDDQEMIADAAKVMISLEPIEGPSTPEMVIFEALL